MKEPKIDWPSDKETKEILDETGMTKSQICDLIRRSIRRAAAMSRRGVRHIAPILEAKRSTWESAWNKDATLKLWFGKVTQANHVKDVHRRLDRICNRFANKKQTIKVRAELPKGFTAQNLGGPLSPNTFKVAIKWIKKSELNEQAAIMIHESKHDWNKDQKIDGKSVYGESMAQQLAKENSGKARRSPENYEHYCLALQIAHEAGAGTTGSGSTSSVARRSKKAGGKKSRAKGSGAKDSGAAKSGGKKVRARRTAAEKPGRKRPSARTGNRPKKHGRARARR